MLLNRWKRMNQSIICPNNSLAIFNQIFLFFNIILSERYLPETISKSVQISVTFSIVYYSTLFLYSYPFLLMCGPRYCPMCNSRFKTFPSSRQRKYYRKGNRERKIRWITERSRKKRAREKEKKKRVIIKDGLDCFCMADLREHVTKWFRAVFFSIPSL